MTQEGPMTPEEGHVEQGFGVRSEKRSDRKKFERDERTFRFGALKVILGVLVLIVLLVLVIGGFNHYFGGKPEVVTTTETTATVEPTATAEPVSVVNNEPEAEPPPVVNDGIWSAEEALRYLDGAPTEQADDWLANFSAAHPGKGEHTLVDMAEAERSGHNFWVYLPKGTWIMNTTRPYEGAPIKVIKRYQLKTERLALMAPDGEILWLASCGNISVLISLPEGEKPRKPTPEEEKELKGRNPYPDSVETHQESVPVPGETPGYPEPDNAERVVQEQEQSYPGNRTPTPSGTDSGSTTNPTNSQTTDPDGSTIDAEIGTEVEYTPPTEETVPPDDQSGFDPYAVP